MIIRSLLDTDLYKFTMGQVALHQFPEAQVKYAFKCRNQADWTDDQVSEIKSEVREFCDLKLTSEELSYLKSLDLFKDSYLDFLKLYSPDYNDFSIELLSNGELKVEVTGSWFTTIYWEVPLLAIVNEVYFKNDLWLSDGTFAGGFNKLSDKVDKVRKFDDSFKFADFGTRRRYSRDWQDTVVKEFKSLSNNFVGTSNLMFAMKYDLTPIGTMAHELFQIGQVMAPLIDSQKFMLESWLKEYRGKLGIALTDIFGFDAFLNDFDSHFATAFDGLRHDSGNPFTWADKALAHYYKLGINTKVKTLVFSDGLDIDRAKLIHDSYNNVINTSFGIGTDLTNNFDNITPLQIVMKIVECNGQPVAKVSDSIGKVHCSDKGYINYIKKVFLIK